MSQKWTSVITEAVLAICGVIFFYMSYSFNDGGTSSYAGAGYYPMLVSGLITLFSITGIIHDLAGKGKNNTKKIDISRIKNVGYVVISIIIIVLFWQLLDLFYVGATLGVGMLLVTLNPKKATKKSLLIDAAIAVGMSIATFLIFELALKIYV